MIYQLFDKKKLSSVKYFNMERERERERREKENLIVYFMPYNS